MHVEFMTESREKFIVPVVYALLRTDNGAPVAIAVDRGGRINLSTADNAANFARSLYEVGLQEAPPVVLDLDLSKGKR